MSCPERSSTAAAEQQGAAGEVLSVVIVQPESALTPSPSRKSTAECASPTEGCGATVAPESACAKDSGRMTPRLYAVCAEVLIFPFSVMFVEMCLVPALPTIQEGFSKNANWVPWILSSYNIVGAIWLSISGNLCDIFGPKWIMVLSMCVYMTGQIIAALSKSSIFILIVGRALQGFGEGASEIGFNIVNRYVPMKYRDLMISLVSGMYCLGMSVGLVGGAAALEKIQWNEIFWFTFPVIATVTICFILSLPGFGSIKSCGKKKEQATDVEMQSTAAKPAEKPEVKAEAAVKAPEQSDGTEAGVAKEKKPSLRDLDYIGILLLIVGVLSLLAGLTFSETWGWHHAGTITLVTVGPALLVVLIVWETFCKHPLIPVRDLMCRNQLVLCTVGLLTGMLMYSMFQIVPYLYESPFIGIKATKMLDVGLYMLPFGIVSLASVALVIGIGTYAGYQIAICCANGVGLLGIGLYIGYHDKVAQIVPLNCVCGLGFGMVMITLMNLITETSPKHSFGAISGANLLLQMVGGSMGPVFVSLILQAKTIPTPYGDLYAPEAYKNAFIFLTALSGVSVGVSLLLPKVGMIFTKKGRAELAERRKAAQQAAK